VAVRRRQAGVAGARIENEDIVSSQTTGQISASMDLPAGKGNAGRVIVLNGTSSAGKTSLARELQKQMSEPYLFCSSDMFWNMTPPHIKSNSVNFPRMKLALAKSVRALADTGHNVLVDIVFAGRHSYDELAGELTGIELTMVKVYCPLHELQKRERERGDRQLGLAESQFATVHHLVPYDVEVDTSIASPAECGRLIMGRLAVKTKEQV
jgi:chloramphenicol 3-O phosphotransferase